MIVHAERVLLIHTPMADQLLLIISDRPFVWRGYKAPSRVVWRWIGEREGDEPNPEAGAFAGDPTMADTYQCVTEHPNLSAVIDIQDPDRARGAIAALRAIRPEAAVLVITANGDLKAPDVAVSRRLEWTDALRVDLEAELAQLECQRRVHDLREFAADAAHLPILVHPDPDPDALASALAVRALLRRDPDATPIVTLGDMTRPENRRMAELLGMRVTVVTEDELKGFKRVVVVDHQPITLGKICPHALAVIDHHPVEQQFGYKFADLRPAVGATATMLTEYITADDAKRMDDPLATALLYGIKTDTDSLTRGCSPADVQAYAYLLSRADLPLLRKLERPSYKTDSARAYGAALSQLGINGDIAVAFLGKLDEDDTHILVDIADFCMALEEITWSAAAAVIGEQLVFTLRHLGGTSSAGDLAKLLAGDEGSGGGHATMARARVPLHGEWQSYLDADIETGTKKLLETVTAHVEELRTTRRSPHLARPVTVHPAGSR